MNKWTKISYAAAFGLIARMWVSDYTDHLNGTQGQLMRDHLKSSGDESSQTFEQTPICHLHVTGMHCEEPISDQKDSLSNPEL